MTAHQRLLCFIAVQYLLFVGRLDAFAPVNPITSFRRTSSASVVQYSTSKKSNNGDAKEEEQEESKVSICLIAADQVLLPGETATIWTEEEQLIDDCMEHNYGVLAMGVVLVDNEDELTNDLLEIASLVEVKTVQEPDEDGDGIFVTLTCVGRVRLDRLQQTYPYFKFACTTVQEATPDQDFTECNLVADNIEAFMKKLTRTEQELKMSDDDEKNPNLIHRYKSAYGRAMELISTDQSNAAQLLTAISWAAFTSLEDVELEHYRTRALDHDNLFERLKLAQYVLREKELRLQGQAMSSLETANSNSDINVEDSCFTDGGFQ